MTAINVGQLVATTLRRRLPNLYDNVSDNVALYNYLKKRGNMKFDSGRDILVPLEYAHASLQWYSGYEALNISPTDIIDAATFDWKFAAIPVSMSGEERLKNAGEMGLKKLAKSKVKNAEKGFVNGLGAAVYSDGTGNSGKEIGGVQLLVSTSPSSGTVGGIAASNTFWQNQYFDASTYLGAAVTKDNVRQAMAHMSILCTRNNEMTDLILADNTTFEHYWNSMQAIQRVSNEEGAGKTPWSTFKFGRADMVLDGGQGGNCPANTSYWLNTDYIALVGHSDRDIEIVGGQRMSVNQDADVQLLMWAGNLVLMNRALQGVMVL